MEIEVGEYIRTDKGYICKIDEIDECKCCGQKVYIYKETIGDLHFEHTYHKGNITKHSKNIIDLIQCGDYVNGSLVVSDTKNVRTETCDGEEHKCIIVSRSKDDVLGWKMIDFDIKDILTKEQYEQNSYKIGE